LWRKGAVARTNSPAKQEIAMSDITGKWSHAESSHETVAVPGRGLIAFSAVLIGTFAAAILMASLPTSVPEGQTAHTLLLLPFIFVYIGVFCGLIAANIFLVPD